MTTTYPVPENTSVSHTKWNDIRNGKREPSEWEKRLRLAIEKALDAGVQYTRQVQEFVRKEIPLSEADAELGKGRVEGGVFGMEVYYCRGIIDTERKAKWCKENGFEPFTTELVQRAITDKKRVQVLGHNLLCGEVISDPCRPFMQPNGVGFVVLPKKRNKGYHADSSKWARLI